MHLIELGVLILELDVYLLFSYVLEEHVTEFLALVQARNRAGHLQEGTHGYFFEGPPEELEHAKVGV